EELEIEGLTLDRALVFPSGLSILIAIFELLEIESMTLAGGALREGLAYEMVDELRQKDIRARTVTSIQSRYQMDVTYGEQVASLAQSLFEQAGSETWVPEPQASVLLQTAAKLHEIGLT
ncbi:Ppx/GppA phosphatase family protein, partial [Vibrio cyclitrophicus]